MPRPADVSAAVKDLFRQPRFKATWNMLTSNSQGERGAAMEAIGRALEKHELTFLDVAQTVAVSESPKVIHKETRVEVTKPNTFVFNGRIDIIEMLDMDANAGEFANMSLLKITIGTRAFRIEPIMIADEQAMAAAIEAARTRQMVEAHVVISGMLKMGNEPCCFANSIKLS